jgi:hypothetical protein
MLVLGLTDGEIARRLGAQRTYLVSLRGGRGRLGVNLARRIEEKFGVRAEWLRKGVLPVFVAGHEDPGATKAILARLAKHGDAKGTIIFDGVDHISINAVVGATPDSQGIWSAGAQYPRRANTPAIATRHPSFFLWPHEDEAELLDCLVTDLILFVVPSAYFHPRYARTGDRIVCVAEAGGERSLVRATLAEAHKVDASAKRRKRSTPKAKGTNFQVALRGEYQSSSYDYLLDCRSLKKLSGRVKILGVALRLERGLINSADAVVEK